jgi:hypothetical protein
MLQLGKYCPQVLPVGVWKEDGRINLKFGCPYRLEVASELATQVRDQLAGQIVMNHIAMLLPERLRGEYS